MKLPKGVYQKVRGSEVFWIRYADRTGRIRREKAGTKSAAIKLYRKRKTEVLLGKKFPETLRSRSVTFSEVAKDTLEYSQTHKLSHEDDTIRMKKLTESFGSRAADSITPQEIERWLSKHDSWKPATANRYRALLSLVYRVAMQNGKVSSNPARLVRQRRENNGRIRFLSVEEENRLRKVIEANFVHHLSELDFALNTGMRMGEQYALTWEDIDFDRRIATIRTSKNGMTRHVRLNQSALSALHAARRQSNGQPWVFLNRFGKRLLRPREWFDRAIRDANIPDFTWHCLRHTFASRLVMAGVGLRTVQELMGHKTIQMTARYAHLSPEHQLAAVEKLDIAIDSAEERQRDSTWEQLDVRPGKPN